MENLPLISKEEAFNLGQKWYFTGKMCQNGHIDKRYVNTGICYACKRARNKVHYSRYPEVISEINKKSYNKHSDKRKAISQKWAETNRLASNEIKRNYRKRHLEKCRESAREYQKIQRLDPFKRLSKNLSKSIWACLHGAKENNTWLSFVNFTIEELIIHLETQFEEGMTWDNYGTYWHVDHIKPLSWFDLSKEFTQAWALANLQPLKAFENLSKNNKYEGKYKPISKTNPSKQ